MNRPSYLDGDEGGQDDTGGSISEVDLDAQVAVRSVDVDDVVMSVRVLSSERELESREDLVALTAECVDGHIRRELEGVGYNGDEDHRVGVTKAFMTETDVVDEVAAKVDYDGE